MGRKDLKDPKVLQVIPVLLELGDLRDPLVMPGPLAMIL